MSQYDTKEILREKLSVVEDINQQLKKEIIRRSNAVLIQLAVTCAVIVVFAIEQVVMH